MKRRILQKLIPGLLSVNSLLLAAEFEIEVDQAVLDNGLTVLICPDSSLPTVSVQTFVNAGSRDEDREGITGLAHVFEHMMFRGTPRFPVYSDAVAPLGAENNAYTSSDYTCYFINVEARFLEKLLEVESDRIRNLIFTPETFRTELGPVKEERRRGVDDDPGGFLEVELDRLAYTTHTYQHPVIGWEEDLETKMTFEDGRQFKEHFYVPNNCVLVIAGNVDVDDAKEWVEEYYGGWQHAEPYVPQIKEEPKQTAERVKNFVWKDDQMTPLMRIGFHTPAAKSDFANYAALRVMNQLLFSRSGRLTRLLKNRLSLVEAISGDYEMRKDPALMTIHARLKRNASLEAVRDSIYSQLDQLKTTPIQNDELERAINNLRAEMIYQLDRASRIAGTVGYNHLIGGDYRKMFELYELYETVTSERIMAMAKEVFDKANRTVVTMVPKGGV